jgi:hypothetical protein
MIWHSDWFEDVKKVLDFVTELTPDKGYKVS